MGWCIFGGQPGLNALAATYYPTDLRSTGIGAMLGVGRFGAILGPLVAGGLLARGWTGAELFRAAAVPAVISTAAMLALGRALSRSAGEATPRAVGAVTRRAFAPDGGRAPLRPMPARSAPTQVDAGEAPWRAAATAAARSRRWS